MSQTMSNPWCPDVCPITSEPFFMWIEHHATGQSVPTYGGPYDSYTIPEKDQNGSYCRERYDHDEGCWRLDDVEDVGVQIVSDQAYISDDAPADIAREARNAALTEALRIVSRAINGKDASTEIESLIAQAT